MSEPKVETGFACGRHYLSVNGYVVAVEGDLCRDSVLPGTHWNSELLGLVVRKTRVVMPIREGRIQPVPDADAELKYKAERAAERARLDSYVDGMLKKTEYAVEATSFEAQTLWAEWSKENALQRESKYERPLLHFEQYSMGSMQRVGELADLPVNLSLFWYRLRKRPTDVGTLVVFWEMCSRVTDSEMAERWLKENLPSLKYSTNAQNFHNVVHPINRAE